MIHISHIIILLLMIPIAFSQDIVVNDRDEYIAAVSGASPGDRILIAPGTYSTSFSKTWGWTENLKGTEQNPITITAQDSNNKPVILDNYQGIQLRNCSYVTVSNLIIKNTIDNGVNVGPGSELRTHDELSNSHHIIIENIEIHNVGVNQGNHDAIKVTQTDHFILRNNYINEWGGGGKGQAVDMVKCQYGLIEDNIFIGKGDESNGVQPKGGSRYILVHRNYFERAGENCVQIGQTADADAYRDPMGTVLQDGSVLDYEARGIKVAGNRFYNCKAPIAWTTSDNGLVHQNTITVPTKWILRILHSHGTDPRWRKPHDGIFSNNLIVYDYADIAVFVNIGSNTEALTWTISHNAWFQTDAASQGLEMPDFEDGELPVTENDPVYQIDPQLENINSPTMSITSTDTIFENIGADAYDGNSDCTDDDGDGYSIQGFYCGAVDCNDNDHTIKPGITELCNQADDNCDGNIDENCETCVDNDGDGALPTSCDGNDCNDADASINPSAIDICENGIAENCQEDAACPNCPQEIGARCKCGNTIYNPQTNLYCCQGSAQVGACSIPSCPEIVTSQCECGLDIVSNGFCCNNVPQSSTCPVPKCSNTVTEPCICGSQHISSGYCCGNTPQLTKCIGTTTTLSTLKTTILSCQTDWSCKGWSECTTTGRQTRTCTDENECGTTFGRPPISQICFATSKETTEPPTNPPPDQNDLPDVNAEISTMSDADNKTGIADDSISESGFSIDSDLFFYSIIIILIVISVVLYLTIKKGVNFFQFSRAPESKEFSLDYNDSITLKEQFEAIDVLEDKINNMLLHNTPNAEIRKKLLTLGWKKPIIDKALKKVKGTSYLTRK